MQPDAPSGALDEAESPESVRKPRRSALLRHVVVMALVAVASAGVTYGYVRHEEGSSQSDATEAARKLCLGHAVTRISQESKGVTGTRILRTVVGLNENGEMAAYVTGEGTEHRDDGRDYLYRFHCDIDRYVADTHEWEFAVFTPGVPWGNRASAT